METRGKHAQEEAGSGHGPAAARDGPDGIDLAALLQRVLDGRSAPDSGLLGIDWAWETDASHRFTRVSAGCARLTGLRENAILGMSRLHRLTEVARHDGPSANHLADLAARRPFRDALLEIPSAHPECRVVALSGLPLFTADGVFAGYRGSARNVTGLADRYGAPRTASASHPVQENPQDKARLMTAALDLVDDAVTLYDQNDRIVLYNRALVSTYRGLEDIIRPGLWLGELVDKALERGLWDIGDADPRAWRDAFLNLHRQVDAPPLTLHFHDGRWVMHRDVAIGEDGRIGVCTDITALKEREARAEAARKAAEAERARLQAAIDALDDAFVLWDKDQRLVVCNDAFRAEFGFLPSLAPGSSYEQLLHELAASGVVAAAAGREAAWVADELASRQQELGKEVVYETHDGRWMMRRDTATSSGDRVGIRTDVSEMKRREVEIEQANERAGMLLADFERTVDTLRMGVVLLDGDLNAEIINRAFYDIWKVTPQEVPVGRHFRALMDVNRDRAIYDIAASDWDNYVNGRLAEIRGGDIAPREFVRADGSTLIYSVTALSGGKRLVCYYDVTELKQREAALRATTSENELFRSLIDNVPVALYAKRPDLKLVYVNRGWSDLTGLAAEDAIGRTDGEIFGLEGETYMEGDLAVLATGAMQVTEEIGIDHETGLVRHQIARKGMMTASDGSLYLIGSTTDISELKRREEELRCAEQRAVLADRAKSEFLANMSHEIRTPMNGVLGMAELLAKTDLDSKQKTFTDIIVKSGNALLTIINDILDFSKIDAGKLVLDPAPFRLSEAIEDVATLMSTRAKEKDLELIVRVAPGLPQAVVGDVGRLRQIVTNLLGNAVKFTDAGHVLVDVSGEIDGDAVGLTLQVTDTGIGIPDDRLDGVFDKFSQVDASSTRRHEGTGLGLAITQRLVALMGGTISVESRLGAGSTFRVAVTLPLAETGPRRRAVPVDVTGARILIVDDNAVNRSILMEQMSSWTFDACAAADASEALAVLDATDAMGIAVDCVVLDYQMPGMNGAALAKAIRQRPRNGDVPIVMLTSVDQSLTSAQNRDLAISAQLLKPARSSALLEAVVAGIQTRRGGRAEAAPPAAAAPERVTAQPTLVTLAPAPRRLDILVAEDNEVNQLVFAQILSETPYTYEIVRNGRLALEAHRDMRPGMILMDVSMPEMNGIEATQAIRQAESAMGIHVPIVGVTAHALKDDRERCLEAGMDDYLPKPVSPSALLEKVHHWLGAARSGRRQAG